MNQRLPGATVAAALAAATVGALAVAAPAAAEPVDNGSLSSLTDQTSLDGTSVDPNTTSSLNSLTDVLGGSSAPVSSAAELLSSFASTGLGDSLGDSLADSSSLSSLSSLGCAVGSTGVTGSGSIGSSGGIDHSVPWLNGQTGMLPSVDGTTKAISHITGPGSNNHTVDRFNVLGTDLGIMWDNGSGETMLAFGDTIGAADDPVCNGLTGNWRSNVLLRSNDDVSDLAHGMTIDSAALASPGQAKEILPSLKNPGVEFTVIPTAGIAVPHDDADGGYRQYISLMSVKSWGAPGEWVTNYSALAYSDDNGEHWESPTFGQAADLAVHATAPDTLRRAIASGAVASDSIRQNTGGNRHFQMGAFVRDHAQDPDDPDTYMYFFGTPSGRSGSGYLSRVHQKDIEKTSKYEYWDGDAWVSDVDDAAVVLDGRVSELSVQYNEYLGKYMAMYTTPLGLVVRTADDPTGPWSSKTNLINPVQVPSFYGAFMHPASSASGSKYLYFVGTTWSDYNVMLLRTDLSKLN